MLSGFDKLQPSETGVERSILPSSPYIDMMLEEYIHTIIENITANRSRGCHWGLLQSVVYL